MAGNLRSSKSEIGAEIKLAANRKPYYDDERLEGEKIQRTQLIGLACLAVTTIALPLYWILEPGHGRCRKRVSTSIRRLGHGSICDDGRWWLQLRVVTVA